MIYWFFCIDHAVINCLHLVFTAIIIGIQFCYVFDYLPLLDAILLQQWYIKNVKNFLFSWQFEFVGLFVYWVQNLKRSKEFYLQLPILFDLDVFAVQPNFITQSIALRLDAFIIGSLPKFLSMIEVFLTNNHELS